MFYIIFVSQLLRQVANLTYLVAFIIASAHDPKNPYYDAKSTIDAPKWSVVRVAFKQNFRKIIPLKELQKHAKAGGVLEGMQTLKRARLSVSMVSKEEFDFVMGLVEQEEKGVMGEEEAKGKEKGNGKGNEKEKKKRKRES